MGSDLEKHRHADKSFIKSKSDILQCYLTHLQCGRVVALYIIIPGL